VQGERGREIRRSLREQKTRLHRDEYKKRTKYGVLVVKVRGRSTSDEKLLDTKEENGQKVMTREENIVRMPETRHTTHERGS
jgi:uncharacterized protein YxjI